MHGKGNFCQIRMAASCLASITVHVRKWGNPFPFDQPSWLCFHDLAARFGEVIF